MSHLSSTSPTCLQKKHVNKRGPGRGWRIRGPGNDLLAASRRLVTARTSSSAQSKALTFSFPKRKIPNQLCTSKHVPWKHYLYQDFVKVNYCENVALINSWKYVFYMDFTKKIVGKFYFVYQIFTKYTIVNVCSDNQFYIF